MMNEQLIAKIILNAIEFAMCLLLFVLPIVYSIYRGNWSKSFRFTWFIWAVVISVFGIFVPAIATLREKATGAPANFDGFGFIIGIVVGWLPGLIIAYFKSLRPSIHIVYCL
jgi:hypothetical protein